MRAVGWKTRMRNESERWDPQGAPSTDLLQGWFDRSIFVGTRNQNIPVFLTSEINFSGAFSCIISTITTTTIITP